MRKKLLALCAVILVIAFACQSAHALYYKLGDLFKRNKKGAAVLSTTYYSSYSEKMGSLESVTFKKRDKNGVKYYHYIDEGYDYGDVKVAYSNKI